MEPSYYQPAVQASPEADHAEILTGFRDLLKSATETRVKLVNYYKGLPISYPATLVELSGDVLELDVHPQQAVALAMSRRTCIKCGRFPHSLLAEVKDSDVRRMMASLHRFSYVDVLAEQRVSLRLELDPPSATEITVQGRKLEGEAMDVSLGGFSIRSAGPSQLVKGEEVALKVNIPNLLHNTVNALQMNAVVIDIESDAGGDLCRFSIHSDPHIEGVLSRFIFQRQVDLIRELKEMS